MAKIYQQEDGILGVCLECGSLIINGEEGCVQASRAAMEKLKKIYPEKKVVFEATWKAYELQHYNYFNLSDLQALAHLIDLLSFCKNTKKISLPSENDDVFFTLSTKYLEDFALKKILLSNQFLDFAELTEEDLILKYQVYCKQVLQEYTKYQEQLSEIIVELEEQEV